jgi:hypothetical protein
MVIFHSYVSSPEGISYPSVTWSSFRLVIVVLALHDLPCATPGHVQVHRFPNPWILTIQSRELKPEMFPSSYWHHWWLAIDKSLGQQHLNELTVALVLRDAHRVVLVKSWRPWFRDVPRNVDKHGWAQFDWGKWCFKPQDFVVPWCTMCHAVLILTKVTWIVLANQCLVFATPGRTKAYPRHLGQTWAFNLEPYQTDCEWLSILSMMTDGVGICLGELQLRSNLPRQKPET